MKIPVRNWYYLYLYAWERLAESESIPVGAEESPEVLDLFARVLASGVEHLIRRGLDRGYVDLVERVPGVRGKMLMGPTVARAAHVASSTVCQFDDLTYDIVPNRIIKETLRQLLASSLTTNARIAVAAAHRRMPEMKPIQLSALSFAAIQLHSNNAFYGFLLDVCRVIHRQSMPTTSGAAGRFWRAEPSGEVGLVFERFVRNFLSVEQTLYRVAAPWIRWHGVHASEEDVGLLPGMQTDIVLSNSERTIVIDTKFYTRTLAENRDRVRLQSAHLYQMFAYLTNIRPATRGALEGILLYPAVEHDLDARYGFADFDLRVVTLDLSGPWQKIRSDLLGMVDAGTPPTGHVIRSGG